MQQTDDNVYRFRDVVDAEIYIDFFLYRGNKPYHNMDNEPVQPGSKEYEAGFRRIPQITIKRMKNAVKKHPGEGFQIFR